MLTFIVSLVVLSLLISFLQFIPMKLCILFLSFCFFLHDLLRHLTNGHCPHRNWKNQETLSGRKSHGSKKPPSDMSTTYPIPEETGEILWITAPFYSKQQQRTWRPCSIAPKKDLYSFKVKKDTLLLSSLYLHSSKT